MTIKILNNPTSEEIIENIKTRKPFKIVGMMEKWKATKKWDMNFFRKNFGKNKIRVKDINKNKEMKMTISNYIDYINEPYDENKLLYASDITVTSLSDDLYNEYDVDFFDKFDLFRNIQKYIDTDLNLRWIFIGKKKLPKTETKTDKTFCKNECEDFQYCLEYLLVKKEHILVSISMF